MSVPVALLLGLTLGFVVSSIWFIFGRLQRTRAEYELYISELIREHEAAIVSARKRSVNTSRAVIKGKMAEQFAPIFPEFTYLPSDAKFLGDPIDYVVFSGYSDYREGLCEADEIEIVFIDIKSGRAKLTQGQEAIAEAIRHKRVRFETVRINL